MRRQLMSRHFAADYYYIAKGLFDYLVGGSKQRGRDG